MKEYRLLAWTELPAPFDRTAYRRMLSDMSHRHMTLEQLASIAGVKRQEVQLFIDALEAQGLLEEREFDEPHADSVFDSLRPLGGWIRRALHTTPHER
jgi:hypothetical protein